MNYDEFDVTVRHLEARVERLERSLRELDGVVVKMLGIINHNISSITILSDILKQREQASIDWLN